jgi:hypothetical protein
MHLLTINSQSASLTKTNIPGRLKIENKNVFYFISFFLDKDLNVLFIEIEIWFFDFSRKPWQVAIKGCADPAK